MNPSSEEEPKSSSLWNEISLGRTCSLGGKAQGLAFMRDMLASNFDFSNFSDIPVSIPSMTVICTDVFDEFMQRNDLRKQTDAGLSDERIAHAFQNAELPFEILGELRSLIERTHTPLAIRSSSMLEDSTHEPFAGIYATKMIPNNQFDPAIRFRKLMEAIKFVYASTYFAAAKGYRQAIKRSNKEEKMAVIIQEVVGKRHRDRFYPELSGVVRSYNFYPMGRAKNEDGIVHLALGLGKTIVDGEVSWAYSPAYPEIGPPYRSIGDLLQQSQNRFWAINMGDPPAYDPIHETEYLLRENIVTAEKDGVLRYLVSTFDINSGRLSMGTGNPGPRVLTFAPLLVLKQIPLNDIIKELLLMCEGALETPVEIEFAMTFNPHRFGFLQVRPMVVSMQKVDIESSELEGDSVLVSSENVLGNGILDNLTDIIYVKPDQFETRHTRTIAQELEKFNRKFLAEGRSYVLIVFGRLGSFDQWLGIPVNWGQISAAKVIIEATQQNINVELSQGSHFFHNIINLGIRYFSVSLSDRFDIDWSWLKEQPIRQETQFLRHITLPAPLHIKVDGRNGRGVIHKTQPE